MMFHSESEWVEYVESQVQLALPDEWRIERLGGSRLGWRIKAPGQNIADYLLYVTADGSSLLFVHGNTDAGPLCLEQMLLNAKMLDVKALQLFPLSKFVQHILKTCDANRWGLT